MRAAVGEGIELDLRVISFDWGSEPLRFALGHAGELGYFGGFEPWCWRLVEDGEVEFEVGGVRVWWRLEAGDFAGRMRGGGGGELSAPHAVLYDPHSPRVNPEMWTLPVFRGLYGRLDAGRGCGLATYTRSTAVRVGMLLAGFWVGAGEGTATKEETTLAANRVELAGRLLDGRWLERVRRSGAAEPWEGAPYEGRPLGAGTWERLAGHPQFAGKPGASHGGR
jgi:hypothetical protein